MRPPLRPLIFATALVLAVIAVPAVAQTDQLPDDSDRYSVVVVTESTPTPDGSRLLAAIDSHPRLSAIAERCNVHRFTPTSDLYRLRYAESLGSGPTPIFALVRSSDGGVLYKASGRSIPAPDDLAAELTHRVSVDRDLERADGVEWGPDPRRPFEPGPRNPRRPFDGLIPDSVTVQPRIDVAVDGEVMIAVGVAFGAVLIGIIVFGGVALWFLRSP